jgi:dienelactone hydrolase
MTIKNGLLCVVITISLAVVTLSAKTASSADPIFVDAEVVEFESVPYTYTPSPFKVKQAKKLGKTLEVKIEPSVPVIGYLARPQGEEPRPAVVLLHGCAGISEAEEIWSDRLVSWGYVVFSVDSYTPRGHEYLCDEQKVTSWARALDTYGAKQYLSTLSFVDPARIAVIGMSHGGWTVFKAIAQSTSEGLAMKPFQAAIAFYPNCISPEPINTPTLILAGGKDQWFPAEFCVEYVNKLQPQHDVTLKVFADAHHGFDLIGIDTVDGGYTVRYNAEASAEANEMSREFLEKWL